METLKTKPLTAYPQFRGRFRSVGDTGIESHSTLCAVMRLTS
jgi:hypothetical protein